ncbi:MAG: hypothetical protein JOY98_06780 [Candidatus Eremiobacteraeota bacterium]|nr:hypothetical protein [Candidatus Eremiobacteraeota bacterium]
MIALLVAAAGFVNVPAAVKAHPLYPAIVQYDREIAALRATERVPGLTSIPQRIGSDARAMQAAAANAARQARASSAANGAAYRAREQNLLAGMNDGAIPQRDAAVFREQAGRSASATLTAYRAATAERTQRALAAREQQFRERESTLAFDLEKRDAGERLLLQVKLRDLRLDGTKRRQLQSRLAALDARVDGAVAALRRADDAQLATYAGALSARENADDARMAGDVARATTAHVADRPRVAEMPFPETAALRGYDPAAAASSIAANLERAGRELGERFARLQSVARTSDADTNARIAAIETARRTLYDAMIRQIREGAQRLARERGLASVAFGARRPPGAVDLTGAIPLPI